jgi:hypothetical protein
MVGGLLSLMPSQTGAQERVRDHLGEVEGGPVVRAIELHAGQRKDVRAMIATPFRPAAAQRLATTA